MKIPSDTFCSMAWNHQFVDPTGRVKPCCRFDESKRPRDHNLRDRTLLDVFNGDWMSDIRKSMLAGERIPGCIRCYQEEDAGKKSLRQRYNDSRDLPIDKLVDLEDPTIRWIELAISNDCNLACRMCDSRYAWKWFQEESRMFGQTHNEFERTRMDISNIYPFIDNLVHVKFTGGEPLVTPEHWILIDRMLEGRERSDVFLNYSTNCTIYPKEEWIEKWSRFKKVEFALSFDSCDPGESEYIRWPSKWHQTERVTRRFLELKRTHGFNAFLRSTVSVLNVWNLPQTMAWWVENDTTGNGTMNPTHLTYPSHLSVTVLPYDMKEMVRDRFMEFSISADHRIRESLTYISNYMFSRDDSHLIPTLVDYIGKTDSYRGQDFSAIYPQFAGILNRS